MDVKTLATWSLLAGSVLFGRYGKSQDYIKIGENPKDKYSIICLGDAYDASCKDENTDRFVAHFSTAYQSMLENGYDWKDIHAFTEDGIDGPPIPSDGTLSTASVKKALDDISKKIDENDELFLYFNDHGYIDTFHVDLGLDDEKKVLLQYKGKIFPVDTAAYNERIGLYPDEGYAKVLVPTFKTGMLNGSINDKIYLTELKEYVREFLGKAGPERITSMFSFCYGGNFSEIITRMDESMICISPNVKDSKAMMSRISSFDAEFMRAMRPRNMWWSDTTGDGRLSYREIYNSACEKDFYTRNGYQKPVMIGWKNFDSIMVRECEPIDLTRFEGVLRDRIGKAPKSPDGKPGKYGLIIKGNDDISASSAYISMLENGFENVYVLSYDGKESYYIHSDGMADAENLKLVFGQLSSEMDSLDKFVMYVDGVSFNDSLFMDVNSVFDYRRNCEETAIPESSILEGLSRLKHGKGLLVYGRNLENMAELTGKGNNIAVTTRIKSGGAPYKGPGYEAYLFEGFSPKRMDVRDLDGDGLRTLPDAMGFAGTQSERLKSGADIYHIVTGRHNLEDFSLIE
jgi:hypothetical protein